MIPEFNKVHNKFKLNDASYNHQDLKEVAYSLVKEGQTHGLEIGEFLLDWLDDKDHILIQTSGSTGQPKQITLKKQAMVASAIVTGDYFSLRPGNRALLCLPAKYIAGKMMLVRAMILGLELDVIKPSTEPNIDVQIHYDFSAMLPIQLANVIQNIRHIKTIIVGGAPVSQQLIDQIQSISSTVYETYGMTETITHVAVKQLNKLTYTNSEPAKTTCFKVLPTISISQDARDCLVINAPHLSKNNIVTNDVIKLYSDSEFEWLGRFDNVINSGGKKLFPEVIEKKLASQIDKRFFVSSEADALLGHRVILIIEDDSKSVNALAFKTLEKHEIPKKTYTIPKFAETASGKIQRQKTLELLK